MERCKHSLFGVALLLGVAVAQVLDPPLGGWKYDQNCDILDFPLDFDPSIFGFPFASEDVEEWKDGIFIVSAGLEGPTGAGSDRKGLVDVPYTLGALYGLKMPNHHGGYSKSGKSASTKTSKKSGAMSQVPLLVKLELQNLPDEWPDLNFRPHGIYLDDKTDRLLVISHNEQEQTEYVVVFKVLEDDNSGMPILKYQVAVTANQWELPDPAFYDSQFVWVLNDVIALPGNNFMVTTNGPFDLFNPANPTNAIPKPLWYCPLPDDSSSPILTIDCTAPVPDWGLTNFGPLNGITVSDDQTRIWVSNIASTELIQIDHNVQEGSFTVSGEISTAPAFIDNVQFINGKLYGAAIAVTFAFAVEDRIGAFQSVSVKQDDDPSLNSGKKSYSGGSGKKKKSSNEIGVDSPEVTVDDLEVEMEFQVDPSFAQLDFSPVGPFLVSTGVPYQDSLILGSPSYPGVAICPKKTDN